MVKEKIAIVSSMAAVATFLVGVSLLMQLLVAGTHEHIYDLDFIHTDGRFILTGSCVLSDCDNPSYSEELSLDDLSVENVSPSCKAEGKTVYGIERFGETYKIEEHSERTSHVLSGKTLDNYKNSDGTLNFDVAGIKLYNGADYICGGIFEGYFVCENEDCGEKVVVRVYKPHVGEFVTTLMPTCDTEGIMTSVCIECSEMLDETVSIAAVGHEYSYSLEGEVVDGKADVARVCVREGCTSEKQVYESVDVTVYTSKSPSCNICEEKTYTFSDGNEEISFVEVGKTRHEYVGGAVSEGDTVAYGEGVYLFDGASVVNGTADGYVICKNNNCHEYVKVKVTGVSEADLGAVDEE